MPPPQEEDAMQHPVAFIGIGSKNEQEMQQLIIKEKVGIYLWQGVSIIINIIVGRNLPTIFYASVRRQILMVSQ